MNGNYPHQTSKVKLLYEARDKYNLWKINGAGVFKRIYKRASLLTCFLGANLNLDALFTSERKARAASALPSGCQSFNPV